MCNECRNIHANFGGAARRRFYAIWKKPQGGADIPPSVRGLILLSERSFLGAMIDDMSCSKFIALATYYYQYM